MHRITFWFILRILVVLGLVITTVREKATIESGGWVIRPVPIEGCVVRRCVRKGKYLRLESDFRSNWRRLKRTWHIPLVRSLVLWGLWQLSGQVGCDWFLLLPWVIWVMPDRGKGWRWLKEQAWQAQRVLMLVYLWLGLEAMVQTIGLRAGGECLGIGCMIGVVQEQGETMTARVEVERQENGDYLARLNGQFTLRVDSSSPFRVRMLIIFLGLLQGEGDARRSRRTRDGRTPLVRQEQMAGWFGCPQEHISRWTKYWLEEKWADMLSLKSAEVLTADLVERIVTVCATFPNWNSEQVYQHLHQQGLKVTRTQVEQSAQRSGWKQLQATLFQRYEMGVSAFHLREAWLLEQLLALVQSLLVKVETGQSLTPEEHLTQNDLQILAKSLELKPQTPFPAQPWMLQVEQVVFRQGDATPEAVVCCPGCGCQDVKRKGKQPRWKKFYDHNGELQQTAVYRYSCPNPECTVKSFTHFPDGLLPYSPYRTQFHLLALQMYSWGYSTFRRTATALGIHSMTAWRWVSQWGHDLLPIAALFGVLRSSGVVGVDEKYVLVPKNDKPAGDMRRWMYVYLAVDVCTYDLLHIAIYPYNDHHSAKAFLLALRTKGYHPTAIVTDLRQDYGPLIAQVFPNAVHHECIFHALQNVQKYIKDLYGMDYARLHPQAALLKQQIYAIFDTLSPCEAQLRYQQVLAFKGAYLQAMPSSGPIFDFLEHHWPKLVNAIGSDTIPTTNNTVELVIRRFDQHYQNFCGFDSIDTAQSYLGVFEKVYRFTPFSQDAQPRIRGKAPLQLAGYDINHLPMASLCSGLSIDWTTEELPLVPN